MTNHSYSDCDLPFTSKLQALAKFTIALTSLWLAAEAARAQCIPTNGLVSWWGAEGNAADNVGGNSGALASGAGTAPGQVGLAFSLNGQNSYIEVPDNATLDPRTNSFTLAAWMLTTDLAGTVVSKYDCGGFCPSCISASRYTLYVLGGYPVASIRDVNPGCLDSAPIVAWNAFVGDGAFHHLALCRDIAAGQFWLYVDGQLAASTNLDVATGGDITNGDGEPDPLLFGAKTRAGTSGQEVFFKGLIDEVRLYQRSLSPTEIENLYAAEGGAPIVAYCPSRLDPLLALASLRRRLLLGIGGLSYGFVLAQGNQCRRARWRFSFHDATRGGRAAILSSAERKLTCQPRPDCPASDQLWAHGFRSSPIRVD